jgi:hypothetical protein
MSLLLLLLLGAEVTPIYSSTKINPAGYFVWTRESLDLPYEDREAFFRAEAAAQGHTAQLRAGSYPHGLGKLLTREEWASRSPSEAIKEINRRTHLVTRMRTDCVDEKPWLPWFSPKKKAWQREAWNFFRHARCDVVANGCGGAHIDRMCKRYWRTR